MTSISKYEKEEKNKTHFIRGVTKEIKDTRIEDPNNIKEKLLNNNLINSENNNNLINSENNNNNINEKNNDSFGDDLNDKKSEKKKYVELSDIQEKKN